MATVQRMLNSGAATMVVPRYSVGTTLVSWGVPGSVVMV